MKTNKKRNKKINNLIIPICLFIIIDSIILIIFMSNNKKTKSNTIIGSWTTDGVTIYTFNKDNTGVLKVSLTEYDFTYTIDDKNLFIDLKNEKAKDVNYTYKFKDDKLILNGENGEFTFKKTVD